MKRHAYLIMAYNNPDQLKKLLGLLDDERNDIFVHIDTESLFPMDSLQNAVQHSQLTILDRVPVYWGDYSQIQSELNLLQAATSTNSTYSYYHLLPGMDLPLKTQDEIHSFFNKESKEFIATVTQEVEYHKNHVRYYYPLQKNVYFRTSKILKITEKILIQLQKIVKVNRVKSYEQQNWHFFDGWQWFSITDSFARFILAHEQDIKKIFYYAKAPDEMVLQTLAMNSEFRERLASTTSLTLGSMRMIDWKRGKPYVFRMDDLDMLLESPCMFARKFDERVDSQIIDELYRRLKPSEVKEQKE